MRVCLLVSLLVGWSTASFAQVTAAKDKDKAEKAIARKTITIEVTNAAIEEVLQKLFDLAGEKGVFPQNEATRRKLTAILKEIPFESALSMVANAAGLKVEHGADGWVLSLLNPSALGGFTIATHSATPMTFQCPHCSKSLTVLQKPPAKSAACPKCNRPQQPEWEFCPSCGTKRGSDEGTFSFCPFCGKPVKVEFKKAEVDSAVELVRQLESPLGASFAGNTRSAARFADELRAKGVPWLGAQLMDVTAAHQKELGLTDTRGALVIEVQNGGPAAAAGLRKNDVIVAVDTKPVASTAEAVARIRAHKPQETTVLMVRREQKTMTIRVQVGEMPAGIRD